MFYDAQPTAKVTIMAKHNLLPPHVIFRFTVYDTCMSLLMFEVVCLSLFFVCLFVGRRVWGCEVDELGRRKLGSLGE